jgi:hypothetical protein
MFRHVEAHLIGVMQVRLVDVTDEGQWRGAGESEPMVVKTRIAHLSVDERRGRGKEARSRTAGSARRCLRMTVDATKE